jgi:hypothetical protein
MRVTNNNITHQCASFFTVTASCCLINNLTVTKTDEAKVSYRLMPSSATNFVGRADYLSKLEDIFMTGDGKGDSRPVAVLCAMGGMGKSQIAIKFAETRRHV